MTQAPQRGGAAREAGPIRRSSPAGGSRRAAARATLLAATAALVLASGCRPLRVPPPAEPGRGEPVERSVPADGRQRTDDAARDSISPEVAAIIDSIRMAVRDSIRAATVDSVEARARRDSIARVARADSIAAAARADSIEAARRDSLEAARRDSIAAAARRDSIAAAARRDSIAAAARRDSIAAAQADSIAAAIRRDSIAQAAADSVAAALAEATPVETLTDDLEELRALGPSFIPVDESPQTIWNTETQATLTKLLLPVLRQHQLPARTQTNFWLLLSRAGDVEEVVVQTSSGHADFDRAAESFVRQLTFIPAIRANRPVASWVLREISIIMR